MRGTVVDVGQLIGGEPGVLVMPATHQPAYGGLDEPRQIPGNEPGVFSGQLHLAAEAQVVTDEDLGTSGNARRERLIMTVTKAQHPAVILIGFAALDLHEAEVAGSVVAEAVGLIADDETVGPEGLFHMGHQSDMGDGRPCVGGPRRGDVHDLFAFDRPGSAMKEEIRAVVNWTLDGKRI